MKYNKILSAFAGLLLIGASSCADEWGDHYAEGNAQGEGTLWQAINNDPALSNFKDLLLATGYEPALNGSQVFTVFAPTSDQFTASMRDELIARYNAEKAKGVKENKNSVIKEFVQNHISLYNYSVSPAMPDTSINMMNGKNVPFTSSKFSGIDYVRNNVLTGNGVLFTINKVAEYSPNIYEAISKDPRLSGVYSYLSKYNIEEFLPGKSVPGEIIDGKTHYLDSVTVTTNDILKNRMKALLDSEDSTYWTVIPTDDAWNSQLSKTSKYYLYDKKVPELDRDSFQYHFPRLALLRGMSFSRSANPKIFREGTATAKDSVISTNAVSYLRRQSEYGSYDLKYYQFSDPFGKDGVFAGREVQQCSNGKLYKADVWNIDPQSTYLKDIIMEGESTNTLDSLNVKSDVNKTGNTKPEVRTKVTVDNPFYGKVSGINGGEYIQIEPSGAANFSNALFDIHNVLSNVPYDVYIVTAPAIAGNKYAVDSERLPTIFRVSLQCHDANGNAYYVNNDGKTLQYQVYKDNIESKGVTTNNTQAKVLTQLETSYIVDEEGKRRADVVDSLYVGTYTFPTCSYGLGQPQVKMLIDSRVSNTQVNNNQYNRILRIDCIVFKPRKE